MSFPANRPPRLPLLGRARELATLCALLDAARAGAGGVAFLAGEPGIGKTRTAEEIATLAQEAGFRVAWGRCYEMAGAPAFWPWTQVLRALEQDLASATPAPQFGETAGGDHDEAERFRLFEQVAGYIARAARRPLLILLDNVHQADEPSLLLLQVLARQARGLSVLLLATYREGEFDRNHPLHRTITDLVREEAAQRIDLAGLPAEEVRACITAVTGIEPPRTLAAAIARETEGNPLFITEIARMLAAEGRLGIDSGASIPLPSTVADVISRRLDRLSARCRRVLRTAAVIGREFSLAALERVSETPSAELLDLLEEAEAARVVGGVPDQLGTFQFSHALIRETLYGDVLATRRVRLHRQVGEALADLWTADEEPHLSELAWHFVQAAPGGDAARAVAYARRAGDRARAMLAFEEAARQYELALQALAQMQTPAPEERATILLMIGEMWNRVGDAARARTAFRRAAETARRLENHDLLAHAALGHAELPDPEGPEVAVHLLEDALAWLPPEDSPLRARTLGALAEAHGAAGITDKRDALSREAVAMARRTGDPAVLAATLNSRHWVLLGGADLDERLAVSKEMQDLAGAGRDRGLTLKAYRWRIIDLLELGDITAVDVEIAGQARLAEERREGLFLWHAGKFAGMRAFLAGRLADAERLARETRGAGERLGIGGVAMVYTFEMFAVRREQGRLGEMAPVYTAAAGRFAVAPLLRAMQAQVLLAAGQEPAARATLAELAADGFAALNGSNGRILGLTIAGELCVALGDLPQAEQIYAHFAPCTGRVVVDIAGCFCAGPVDRVLGLLAGLRAAEIRAGWDEAAAHFEDALAVCERLRSPLWTAHTRADYAALLLRRGHPQDAGRARSLLSQAADSAQSLGLVALAERVAALSVTCSATLAASAAATPPLAEPAGPHRTLTEREAEVLQLIGSGLSNKAIADRLVVSVRTVERHLLNIYAKIGARGRADAIAFALKHSAASSGSAPHRSNEE